MADAAIDLTPDIQGLVTEDETPVDHMPSEKHQRLLTEALYSSWDGLAQGVLSGRSERGGFCFGANPADGPGCFPQPDVAVAHDWWQKEHRSYLL